MKLSDNICAWCAVVFTGLLSAGVTLMVYVVLIKEPARQEPGWKQLMTTPVQITKQKQPRI